MIKNNNCNTNQTPKCRPNRDAVQLMVDQGKIDNTLTNIQGVVSNLKTALSAYCKEENINLDAIDKRLSTIINLNTICCDDINEKLRHLRDVIAAIPLNEPLPETTTTTLLFQEGRGYLYNLFALTGDKDGDGTPETSIANTGWHPMTFEDMFDLVYEVTGILYNENDFQISDPNGYYKKLMIDGEDNWHFPVGETANELGFNARGAGARDPNGHFLGIGQGLFFVTFDKKLDINKEPPVYKYGNITIFYYYDYKDMSLMFVPEEDEKLGTSVRLVKDNTTLQHGETGVYIGNDGKAYPTICIGTKEWIAENLFETKFRDGTDIPYIGNITSDDDEQWAEATSAAYCIYPDIS